MNLYLQKRKLVDEVLNTVKNDMESAEETIDVDFKNNQIQNWLRVKTENPKLKVLAIQ